MEEMVQRGFGDFAPQIVKASEPHMACLFLLDTSGSMQGEPINELESALNRFKIEVCEDKTTRDVLDVAIVEFNSTVNVVQEFVPIEYMEPVSLKAYGGTDMNGGLRTAIDMVIERGRFYSLSGTQPYCPWIVMITDGYPNDSIDNVAEEILSLDQQDKLRLWSLAVKGADTKPLNKLGHGKRVLALEGYDFSKFFDWVNKSMRSISVSSPGEKVRGQELPDNVNKAIDDDWM
ncbi:vWA domain-containing protein [Catonella massiliensis]|uniref:VWA domain-containing protein n=1 Tax=Catonella massiliensis TaxID=2799636 RepID=A0ABS1J0X1_9FIRM|nr:VWA domain-containing protein [Catonella massiliensis]MBK5897787.1 VWA domain-containing protein [Catonella massiliensis]